MKKKLHKSWQHIRTSVSETFNHNTEYKQPKIRRRLRHLSHQASRRYRNKGNSSFLLFAKEMLNNPRSIGAACPSSKYLANAMAKQIKKHHQKGLVIELGGGTGTITRALLRQGIPAESLITIEQSPALAAHLRHQFPQIRVIEGDASHLKKLLGHDAKNVQAVISGLPLRSLPKPVVRAIMQQVHYLLPPDHVFVQFTYNLRSPSTNQIKYLTHAHKQMVWKNFPPARVDTFSRTQTPTTFYN